MSRLGSSFSPLMIALIALAVLLFVVWFVMELTDHDGPIVLIYLALVSALAVVFLSTSRSRR